MSPAVPLWSDASDLSLALAPVDPSQVMHGHPCTGDISWDQPDGTSWGVWEMTPGVMRDVEHNEMCVIIKGEGVLTRVIDGISTAQILRPGIVLNLRVGEETLWEVTSALRKVYRLEV